VLTLSSSFPKRRSQPLGGAQLTIPAVSFQRSPFFDQRTKTEKNPKNEFLNGQILQNSNSTAGFSMEV